MNAIPLILQPGELHPLLGKPGVVVVDLSNKAYYNMQHIPGAVHFEASELSVAHPPVMGLLPPEETIGDLLSEAGIDAESHVVAYDAENGIKASRFLWTLDVVGHPRFSLLDGGLVAWVNAGLPLDNNAPEISPSDYRVTYGKEHRADKRYILDHLGDPGVIVLDTRTPAEFNGMDRRAMRAGHIPGAVNIDWSRALTGNGDPRLRPADELQGLYTSAGITPDKEIIVHCQTHQRSSHTYVVLKSLGYPRIKGYPGSWSDWGNDPNTPVE